MYQKLYLFASLSLLILFSVSCSTSINSLSKANVKEFIKTDENALKDGKAVKLFISSDHSQNTIDQVNNAWFKPFLILDNSTINFFDGHWPKYWAVSGGYAAFAIPVGIHDIKFEFGAITGFSQIGKFTVNFKYDFKAGYDYIFASKNVEKVRFGKNIYSTAGSVVSKVKLPWSDFIGEQPFPRNDKYKPGFYVGKIDKLNDTIIWELVVNN